MNIVFDDGQQIIGKAPEWFFKPIDNIYGSFEFRDTEQDKEKKEKYYLKENDNLTHGINLLDYKSKLIENKGLAFKIKSSTDSTNVAKYNIEIIPWTDYNANDLINQSQEYPIIVAPSSTFLENPNFKDQNFKKIHLRLGKYSANRYVIYFHGESETNNPGRIPAE